MIWNRKLGLTAFVWSLVYGFAVGDDLAIEDIRRTHLTFADRILCSTSFHDWFTAALAAFLRELIDEALQETVASNTMADQLD